MSGLDGLADDFALGCLEQTSVRMFQFPSLSSRQQCTRMIAQGLVGGRVRNLWRTKSGAHMIGVNGVPGRQKKDFAHNVLQFPDISGPGLCLKEFHCVRMNGWLGSAEGL